MSSPRRPHPPLPVRERATCMCVHGRDCSSFAPGHALHLLHARLVAATPSEWRDAVVAETDAVTGESVLHTVFDGQRITVWSAGGPVADVGEPVAVHGRYGVVSLGTRRLNVAVVSRVDVAV